MTVLFNNFLITQFNKYLFDTLLYKHHMSVSHPKYIQFDDDSAELLGKHFGMKQDIEGTKGYYFAKDNIKYILPKDDCNQNDNLNKLPIRIKKTVEVITKTNDVVKLIEPEGFVSFKVEPKKVYDFKTLTELDGIVHDNMETWTLLKLISYVAYCRRINVLLSGLRHCLPKGTIVKTDMGNVPIEDINDEYQVWTYNFKENKKELKKAKMFNSGMKQVVKIHTDKGVIECSPKHRWIIERNGAIIEQETKDLLITDNLIQVKGT